MNVVHVLEKDRGGAGRAAHRLHAGLRGLAVSSVLYTCVPSTDPHARLFKPSARLSSRVRQRLRTLLIGRAFRPYAHRRRYGQTMFSDDRSRFGAEPARQLPPADILNLHWISNFIDHGEFFTALPRDLPLVWSLHDTNAFTGGCHYTGGCRRFETACGACPELFSRQDDDLSRRIWRRKQQAFAAVRDRLHVVTASRWLAHEAARSSLLRDVPSTVIPYSVDSDTFVPVDRAAARQALGIPAKAHVILMACHSLDDRRKGFDLLLQALAAVSADVPDIFLVSFGQRSRNTPVNLPYLAVGSLESDRLMSVIYSAADVFVIPSREEVFGLVCLESMACGTPAVGFAVGGIPDMIRPHETGLLAPPEDTAALAAAIRELLTNGDLRARLGQNCRDVAVKEFGPETQARRYLAVYEALCARWTVTASAIASPTLALRASTP
jgi:glycosyltransferase involved in cell wall biosynthesis